MFRTQLLAFVVAAALAVVFCLCFVLPRVAAGGPAESFELEHRINPNDATPESLARLPGIGPARAQAIAAYRENFSQADKNRLAFRDCTDLQNVKGIGPVTAENMCEWLKF
jgi:competence ComEA-like helix-hairpin-helix protein